MIVTFPHRIVVKSSICKNRKVYASNNNVSAYIAYKIKACTNV